MHNDSLMTVTVELVYTKEYIIEQCSSKLTWQEDESFILIELITC